MGLRDGLASLQVVSQDISGTNIYGATDLQVAAGTVGNAELANNAASGTKVSLEYPVALGLGSPAIGNIAFQAGSSATTGGSQVWLVFPTAFAAAPQSVVVAPLNLASAAGNLLTVGSVTAGSCLVQSEAASKTFSWFAIGSGRI